MLQLSHRRLQGLWPRPVGLSHHQNLRHLMKLCLMKMKNSMKLSSLDQESPPAGAEGREGRCMILVASGRARGQILCTALGSMASMLSTGSARSPKARTT